MKILDSNDEILISKLMLYLDDLVYKKNYNEENNEIKSIVNYILENKKDYLIHSLVRLLKKNKDNSSTYLMFLESIIHGIFNVKLINGKTTLLISIPVLFYGVSYIDTSIYKKNICFNNLLFEKKESIENLLNTSYSNNKFKITIHDEILNYKSLDTDYSILNNLMEDMVSKKELISNSILNSNVENEIKRTKNKLDLMKYIVGYVVLEDGFSEIDFLLYLSSMEKFLDYSPLINIFEKFLISQGLRCDQIDLIHLNVLTKSLVSSYRFFNYRCNDNIIKKSLDKNINHSDLLGVLKIDKNSGNIEISITKNSNQSIILLNYIINYKIKSYSIEITDFYAIFKNLNIKFIVVSK